MNPALDLTIPPFPDTPAPKPETAAENDKRIMRKDQGLPSLENQWVDVAPAERIAADKLKVASDALHRALSGFRMTPAAQRELPRLRQNARDALSALTEAGRERRPALRSVTP